MKFVRRHLAAFGLAVALLQSTLQAALPAGLCCATASQAPAAQQGEKVHCCTAQSDADGTCPMHRGGSSARVSGHGEPDCRLVCAPRGEQALLSLTLGGPVPSVVTTIAARPVVAAFAPVSPAAPSHPPDLVTPPPRA